MYQLQTTTRSIIIYIFPYLHLFRSIKHYFLFILYKTKTKPLTKLNRTLQHKQFPIFDLPNSALQLTNGNGFGNLLFCSVLLLTSAHHTPAPFLLYQRIVYFCYPFYFMRGTEIISLILGGEENFRGTQAHTFLEFHQVLVILSKESRWGNHVLDKGNDRQNYTSTMYSD